MTIDALMTILGLTLGVAFSSTLVCLPGALLIGYGLARGAIQQPAGLQHPVGLIK